MQSAHTRSILIAVLCLIVGFGLGRMTTGPVPSHGASESKAQPAAVQQKQLPQQVLRAEAKFDDILRDEAWLAKLDGPQRAEALKEKATGMLFEKNPALRLQLFARFVALLKPGDHRAVLDAFSYHDQQGRLFTPEYELFQQNAGMVEGRALLAEVFKDAHAGRRSLYGGDYQAMVSWSATDPQKAIEWWNELPDGKCREDLAKSLIQGVAANNVELAWKCLQAFPAKERTQFMGTLVRQYISDQGAEGAAKWLTSVDSGDPAENSMLRQKGFDSLFRSLPTFTPSKKAAIVDYVVNEPWLVKTDIPQQIARDWSKQNGAQAVDWAGQLPDALRYQTLIPAALGWRATDPAAFEKWSLEKVADPRFAEVISRLNQKGD